MVKIGHLITSVKIGKHNYKNPEWWAAKHKLKKAVKNNNFVCRANAAFNFSYKVNTVDSYSSVSEIIDSMHMRLHSKVDNDFAPWNSIYRPFKQLIVFKK